MKTNQLRFKSSQLNALNEAHEMLLAALNDYVKIKQLDDKAIAEIKQLIEKQYHQRRLNLFLNDRMERYSGYLESLLRASLTIPENKGKQPHYSNLMYLKQTQKLVNA
jgi:ATP sulfurylase